MPQGIAHMAYGANTNGPGPAYQHAVPNLMLELKLNVLVPSTDRHFLVCFADLYLVPKSDGVVMSLTPLARSLFQAVSA